MDEKALIHIIDELLYIIYCLNKDYYVLNARFEKHLNGGNVQSIHQQGKEGPRREKEEFIQEFRKLRPRPATFKDL